ncbi:MAG TPA: hypothetical protein VN954_05115, partial [Ktedonobacteraceae bacterium]|nr:hypothetical protein [Ktedonobacteraceae bacterium]
MPTPTLLACSPIDQPLLVRIKTFIASCVQKVKNGRLPAVNEDQIHAAYGPKLGNGSFIHLRGERKLC